ncbi:MAG: alpha/beta hydrolase [Marinilabiliales bacterium]|nr:MAG: alpha/beta hydrolase [Marinilabiliales bacterium]
MKKNYYIVIAVLLFSCNLALAQNNKKEIQFNSLDNLSVTGDLYLISEEDTPFILLFHQAGFSRGEYIETAIEFNNLGYNCLAIDQRSGNEVNGILNKTKQEAKKKGLKTEYPDAIPDLEAAINYVIKNYNPEKLIILGSSYSATLSIVLASKYPDKIDAALAFSPGEYFLYENSKIEEFASKIKIPVFITSAKNEESYWKEIYNKIPVDFKTSYLPDVEGIHGSRALWKTQEGQEDYWNAVIEFLNKL